MLIIGYGDHKFDVNQKAVELGFKPGMPFEEVWPIICKVARLDGGDKSWCDPDCPELTGSKVMTGPNGYRKEMLSTKEEYRILYAQGESFREMFDSMY